MPKQIQEPSKPIIPTTHTVLSQLPEIKIFPRNAAIRKLLAIFLLLIIDVNDLLLLIIIVYLIFIIDIDFWL